MWEVRKWNEALHPRDAHGQFTMGRMVPPGEFRRTPEYRHGLMLEVALQYELAASDRGDPNTLPKILKELEHASVSTLEDLLRDVPKRAKKHIEGLMPLTSGFTTRGALKGEGHIHSEKWHRCIEKVKAKSGDVDPYAVCTHSIGYAGSVNPEHRTGGRHASANPKRFKTKEGQRSARARERAAKTEFAAILSFRK